MDQSQREGGSKSQTWTQEGTGKKTGTERGGRLLAEQDLKITPASALGRLPPPTLAVCEILYTSKDGSSFRLQLLDALLGIMSSLAHATVPLQSDQND